MIHFDYLAIALISSILTAIPIVVGGLLVGFNHTGPAHRQRQLVRQPEAEPAPEPELWQPADYDGYHWEPPTDGDTSDPYRWKFVSHREA